MAQEEKGDKLPLDATLLSDAVIELNISRRSVGRYPPEHPIVRTSIEKALTHLQNLFAIRASITLGIGQDMLVVDEYILDRKNPVFREFAQSLHAKGIAAITFSAGLTQAGLTRLHEFVTSRDMPIGKELAERAAKEISCIKLSPIDFTDFTFVEGARRKGMAGGDVWEDYIYGLLEGRLVEGDNNSRILALSPEAVADIVNTAMTEESSAESYDRVITAYITKKKVSRISRDALSKFVSFLDRLKPEIRQQFLSRSGSLLSENSESFEEVVREMTPEKFDRVAALFSEQASQIPAALKNLMEKLSSVRMTNTSNFDFFYNKTAVLHDIELGDDVIKLFGDDSFHAFVSEEYQQELDRMLSARGSYNIAFAPFIKECEEEVIDTVILDIMLDLLQTDFLTEEDYRAIGARVIDFLTVFIETGRFQQIYETYEVMTAQMTGEKFIHETAGILDYFRSDEFITNMVSAITLWGRKERDGAIRLAGALRNSVINPLFAALEEAKDPSVRKFLLSVLESMGTDVLPNAVSRLNDKQWFVVRNMLYLIRECNGVKEADKIRKLVRHDHAVIRMEAVKTLLHFRTPDAVSHVRAFLKNPDPDIRKGTIRLAGTYKVREVVPQLIEYLEKRDVFGAEAEDKIDIVRALGDIGDARAVASLEKIYNSLALFNKGNIEELRVEIFKSLDKYPVGAVRKLIEKGLSSKNEKIRAISDKYRMAL